jgi:hypothetical protein
MVKEKVRQQTRMKQAASVTSHHHRSENRKSDVVQRCLAFVVEVTVRVSSERTTAEE